MANYSHCVFILLMFSPLLTFANECGEVISHPGGTIGKIEYKLNTSLAEHERCVWTIRFPESNVLTFQLTQEGFGSYQRERVHIGTFSKNNKSEILYQEALLEQSWDAAVLNGSLAIILFSTEEFNYGKGFTLEFYGNSVGNNLNISEFSADKIISTQAGFFDYPFEFENRSSYDNNELSSFVFAPPNFFHGGQDIYVPYDMRDLSTWCLDHLVFYNFQPSFGLGRDIKLCDNNGGTHWHTDLTVAIFVSDSEGVGEGFTLRHSWRF